MQMVCALLFFQTPYLPAPLSQLSPWLDWLVVPRADVYERLEQQRHRRVIKTHTPLDGIPLDDRAAYLVVGRHPLDMAVSLYHQGDNLNRERIRELTGGHASGRHQQTRPPVRDWLLTWIDRDVTPSDQLDSLPGVMWHLSDAWARRQQPNIILVHYDDLSADLEGEMRTLATRLGITVADEAWPGLVKAATFAEMRAAVERAAPGSPGILKDPAAFFRRGTSGAGAELLTSDELQHYESRARALAPPDLLTWLHR